MSQSFSEVPAGGKALLADQDASGRLDAWVADQLGGELSRSRIKALIKAGDVLLNGKMADPNHKVQPGDVVHVTIPEPEEAEPRPENIPLNILYEDDSLIVLVKPAGLVVHPGAGNWTGTLVNALLYHCGSSLSGIGGVKRPGIVHRLDKETSGVMVVAKNDAAHRGLSEQFADHGKSTALERAYLAIVWGVPRPLKGTIDAPLGRASDRVRRSVVRATDPDARHAVTHYEVVERFHEMPDATALAASVRCRLETGRTHQIRVHMAHIGHPLIGDPDYGAGFKSKANLLPPESRAEVADFGRQALHAYLLQFSHPETGEIMRFEAEHPEDMKRLINMLRQDE